MHTHTHTHTHVDIYTPTKAYIHRLTYTYVGTHTVIFIRKYAHLEEGGVRGKGDQRSAIWRGTQQQQQQQQQHSLQHQTKQAEEAAQLSSSSWKDNSVDNERAAAVAEAAKAAKGRSVKVHNAACGYCLRVRILAYATIYVSAY